MTDKFELFWSAYPRRVSKVDARKAFTVALTKTTLDEILTALEWQRQQEAWNDRDEMGVLRRVPHPATWLNKERWEDERPVKPNTLSAVIQFPAATCGQCVDGWKEDDMHRVTRCPCRLPKARTA